LVQERNFNKLAGTNYEHGEDGKEFADAVESMGKLSEDLDKYWAKWTQCQNIIIQHKPLY
jgi:hypothetical protein